MIIKITIIDGLARGAVILLKVCNSVAPYILAYSDRESGIVSIYPFIRQALKPIEPPR